MAKVIQYVNLSSADILSLTIDSNELYSYETRDVLDIINHINKNIASSTFRIFVLYPDETINYEIDPNDIKLGGSYSENYQNGQRRSLSFTLYNYTGKYNPDINVLPPGTRLRFEMGVELIDGRIVWFTKGIFVISKVSPRHTPQGDEVNISAEDKFSMFENKTGILSDTYEIPTGTPIKEVIESILLLDQSNSVPFDIKPIIYHSSFNDKKTQATITKEIGDTYGSILIDLATQLSAEIFYNSNGNLVITPLQEVSADYSKPLIANYETNNGDLSELNFDIDYNNIVNRVIVIGNSSNGGVYKAVAENNNSASPFCIQRVGGRTGQIIRDSNITSNILAQERADYELRQQLILKTTTSANVLFNPVLEVNNLIAISDHFYNLAQERFLLQSISCSLDYSNQMSISFSNIKNLPFLTR